MPPSLSRCAEVFAAQLSADGGAGGGVARAVVVVRGALVVCDAPGLAILGVEGGVGALWPPKDPNQRLTAFPSEGALTSAPQPVVGAASAVRVAAASGCGAAAVVL